MNVDCYIFNNKFPQFDAASLVDLMSQSVGRQVALLCLLNSGASETTCLAPPMMFLFLCLIKKVRSPFQWPLNGCITRRALPFLRLLGPKGLQMDRDATEAYLNDGLVCCISLLDIAWMYSERNSWK